MLAVAMVTESQDLDSNNKNCPLLLLLAWLCLSRECKKEYLPYKALLRLNKVNYCKTTFS